MGQVTKLANQIVGLGTLAAMCEGLVFAAKAGQDPEALLSALSGGAANSWMVENLGQKVFEGDFAAMCEGLVFAAKRGVLSALSGGAANSWMVENLGQKVFEGDLPPGSWSS